jgi:hypothetical protein
MLSHLPVATQFLRIWMTEFSNTCDTHGSADKRNCVGYAIRELYAGTLTDSGFHDVVHHTADRAQTNTICSLVDPWHTASVGPVRMVTFGSEQYQWHSNINGGTADPDGPAARSTITGNANTRYILPKASVTVLSGKLGD